MNCHAIVTLCDLSLAPILGEDCVTRPKDLLCRRLCRWKIFKIVFLLSEYQGSDGLDGVESLITNVGGRLLMLQKDKAYPERKSKKVSRQCEYFFL